MQYRSLGKSGLKVSEIGLGTNNIGGRTDEQTSIAVINHALELGVNFIDTAESYSSYRRGCSEEVIGKTVKGKRSQVIIATKFGFPSSLGPAERGGSRSYILKAIEASLKRLETDYIDLYYLHRPDPETPIEETLRALDDLIQSGKVRYIGCSDFTGQQLCEAILTSRMHNLKTFIVIQSQYNMLDRAIEKEVVPCCKTYGVGVVPWGPLAGGFLTGKYQRDQKISQQASPQGRSLVYSLYRSVLTDECFDKLDKLGTFAREQGHTLGELAIAWLLSHPWLGSVIASATKPEQLDLNTAAANWKLTAEDIAELDKIL